jgi:hypothetical protein
MDRLAVLGDLVAVADTHLALVVLQLLVKVLLGVTQMRLVYMVLEAAVAVQAQ